MLKYLVLLCLAIGATVYVTRHDKRAAQDRAEKAAHLSKDALAAEANEDHSQQYIEEAKRDAPSWFSFFRWPDGTTACAIILTLLAIAEQTGQTKRSADISARTLVSQFRPKIILRSLTLHPRATSERHATEEFPSGPPWKIEFLIENTGGTVAHIYDSPIEITWFKRDPDQVEPIQTEKFRRFSLKAGEEYAIAFYVSDDIRTGGNVHIRLNIVEHAVVGTNRPQQTFLQCAGVIRYADDIGTIRKTGFRRFYDVRTQKFVSSNNPEEEYAK